ncbi:unnamed protein product [Prunus armeniaca]|uniref:Uncharacterized protein n=1 Tax=Prunus armeniaca TaxID=36596 RepID=A0A6J5URH4_PRUAR|nr:unnamed protein product [Prunus armeniaca]
MKNLIEKDSRNEGRTHRSLTELLPKVYATATQLIISKNELALPNSKAHGKIVGTCKDNKILALPNTHIKHPCRRQIDNFSKGNQAHKFLLRIETPNLAEMLHCRTHDKAHNSHNPKSTLVESDPALLAQRQCYTAAPETHSYEANKLEEL